MAVFSLATAHCAKESEKQQWTDAIANLRAAMRLDPSLEDVLATFADRRRAASQGPGPRRRCCAAHAARTVHCRRLSRTL